MSPLGILGASVSHEINNLLAIIKGFNDQLRYAVEMNDVSLEMAEKVSTKIGNSVERISKIVQDLSEAHRTGDVQAELKVLQDFFSEYSKHRGFELKIEFKLTITEDKNTAEDSAA